MKKVLLASIHSICLQWNACFFDNFPFFILKVKSCSKLGENSIVLPLRLTSWQETSETGRSFIMLETGNNFLVPSCIKFSKSYPKLAPELYMGSKDEMLNTCSPEGHIPSCHTGLPHSSFCAPHCLELVPHLLQSVHRIVHVGQRLTLFTQDIRVHCVHLSCLMVLPIHLVLRSLSQIKQIICFLFLSTAHKGGLIWPVKSWAISAPENISKYPLARGADQENKAVLVLSPQHQYCLFRKYTSKPCCCLQLKCWCRHSLHQTTFVSLKLHQVNLDQWT